VRVATCASIAGRSLGDIAAMCRYWNAVADLI